MNDCIELSDDQLEQVVGGSCTHSQQHYCGSRDEGHFEENRGEGCEDTWGGDRWHRHHEWRPQHNCR